MTAKVVYLLERKAYDPCWTIFQKHSKRFSAQTVTEQPTWSAEII